MKAEEIYTTGAYVRENPTWHVEDSVWKAEQIMRVLDISPGTRPLRICDIGCGVGGVVAALDDMLTARGVSAEFVGYDIAPVAIERAKALWHDRMQCVFECRDVLTVDRLDYDLCLLIDILEHIEDPAAFVRALHARGITEYVIHLPLESNWLSVLRGRTDPLSSKVGHLRFYGVNSALTLFEQAGLNVMKWVFTPELDLDIKLHRTPLSVLGYLPRKLLCCMSPRLAARAIGGLAMMAQCRFRCEA